MTLVKGKGKGKGKGKDGKLVKMRKQRISSRRNCKEDRISNLPNGVLLHILNLMEAKTLFRTSVLSKQWKDLWKSVTHLSLNSHQFRTVPDFKKFVSLVISERDASISLLKLYAHIHRSSELKLLNRIMKYAVLHKVQKLSIEISCLSIVANNKFPRSIFSNPSISFLWIFVAIYGPTIRIPPFLQLPALTTLSLHKVCFTAGDNDYAEPFSSCKLLKTLLLKECFLEDDSKRLWISNSSLAKLTLHHAFTETYKLVLSTPNLTFLSVTGYIGPCYGEVSSTCNLSFLEEGNLGARYSVISDWLQLFANVKKLTLFGVALENILSVLSHPIPEEIQHPYFVRLRTLELMMDSCLKLSDEKVKSIVQYFLRNSPLTKVNIIKG